MPRTLALLLCATLAACTTMTSGPPPGSTAFTLWMPGIADGAVVHQRYAGNLPGNPNCVGENVAPPLAWRNVPAGTRSLAVIVHDPQGRNGAGSTHWVAYGIDPSVTGFTENEIARPSTRLVAGRSSPNLPTYYGRCPPANTGLHYYLFTLIATDLAPDALPPGLTMNEFLARLEGGRAKGASTVAIRFGR
jgi:Raf kinase inhibitor-like YbhB/YbcL family protein